MVTERLIPCDAELMDPADEASYTVVTYIP